MRHCRNPRASSLLALPRRTRPNHGHIACLGSAWRADGGSLGTHTLGGEWSAVSYCSTRPNAPFSCVSPLFYRAATGSTTSKAPSGTAAHRFSAPRPLAARPQHRDLQSLHETTAARARHAMLPQNGVCQPGHGLLGARAPRSPTIPLTAQRMRFAPNSSRTSRSRDRTRRARAERRSALPNMAWLGPRVRAAHSVLLRELPRSRGDALANAIAHVLVILGRASANWWNRWPRKARFPDRTIGCVPCICDRGGAEPLDVFAGAEL